MYILYHNITTRDTSTFSRCFKHWPNLRKMQNPVLESIRSGKMVHLNLPLQPSDITALGKGSVLGCFEVKGIEPLHFFHLSCHKIHGWQLQELLCHCRSGDPSTHPAWFLRVKKAAADWVPGGISIWATSGTSVDSQTCPNATELIYHQGNRKSNSQTNRISIAINQYHCVSSFNTFNCYHQNPYSIK